MLVKFEQRDGPDLYVIDPEHVVAVVREHNDGGESARVLIRTVDGCEYSVEGDYADVVERINAAL